MLVISNKDYYAISFVLIKVFENNVFQSNTKILKLDLSDNWINPEGGVFIANMLKENCYITELVRFKISI